MSSRVYWLERALEAVVGNRLGAGIYRRWVDRLGLTGRERLLEVGTGSGACARHLADALPDGELTCLDIDARWQATARARLAGSRADVEFVAGDVVDFSRPRPYDAAVLHFVLHDIPAERRRLTLASIARCLKPGGLLCIREPVGHGMPEAEMLGLLAETGFQAIGEAVRERIPIMGETVAGSWVLARPATGHMRRG